MTASFEFFPSSKIEAGIPLTIHVLNPEVEIKRLRIEQEGSVGESFWLPLSPIANGRSVGEVNLNTPGIYWVEYGQQKASIEILEHQNLRFLEEFSWTFGATLTAISIWFFWRTFKNKKRGFV